MGEKDGLKEAVDMEAVLKEAVDLNIPLEEVFENLRCAREGLTTQQAEERLEIFGHNKLEEKKVHISVAHSHTPPFFFFFPGV
ncbi:hypothetical protein GW17_00060048 [Ensete ventricosum]|nr:hypothetical protein GW17_00060048 [Ensete ventricosum]